MQLRLMIVLLFVLFIGCRKDNIIITGPKTTSELLTQKPWLLSIAGFDDNANGLVDPNENSVADCVKDNPYIFTKTGSGSIMDNGVQCPSATTFFTWTLILNDQMIEIDQQRFFILRINENELFLKAEVPPGVRDFLLLFGH